MNNSKVTCTTYLEVTWDGKVRSHPSSCCFWVTTITVGPHYTIHQTLVRPTKRQLRQWIKQAKRSVFIGQPNVWSIGSSVANVDYASFERRVASMMGLERKLIGGDHSQAFTQLYNSEWSPEDEG